LLLGAAWLLPRALATAQSRPQVPEGARVALVFDAGNTSTLGDVIELDFVRSNVSTTAFTYGTGGDYRGTVPTRYKWSAVDESGTPIPLEGIQTFGGLVGGFGGPRALAPGNQYRERLRVQNYIRITRPGTFTLRVRRKSNHSLLARFFPKAARVVQKLNYDVVRQRTAGDIGMESPLRCRQDGARDLPCLAGALVR